MKKKHLFLTAISVIGIAAIASCNKHKETVEEESVDSTPKVEGIDFYIVPDSLRTMDGKMVPNDAPNIGDTVWIENAEVNPSVSKHYESDPMWREVQRHVDNDPYYKQW